mmetsp:Transcript_15271/g.29941  ORF Transcript_15271/g.29941 Transcript_15271/m.29941 type:complete len:243 (+) Transcript_15271:1191-1919(+)
MKCILSASKLGAVAWFSMMLSATSLLGDVGNPNTPNRPPFTSGWNTSKHLSRVRMCSCVVGTVVYCGGFLASVSGRETSSSSTSPCPSRGLPSASTIRPRYPAPIGMDTGRLVRETASSAFIACASPRIATFMSLRAISITIPPKLDWNRNISPCFTPLSPLTVATHPWRPTTWPTVPSSPLWSTDLFAFSSSSERGPSSSPKHLNTFSPPLNKRLGVLGGNCRARSRLKRRLKRRTRIGGG